MTDGYLPRRRGWASIPRCPRHPPTERRRGPARGLGAVRSALRRCPPARGARPHGRNRLRSRSLVALAIAVVVVPAAAQAAESAADPPPGAAQADPQAMRDSVVRLGHRAREHATRLGLRPRRSRRPPRPPPGCGRQGRRLRQVVAFLASRDELEQPVDERPAPPALPRGPGLVSLIRHQHRRATRLALALGLERPRLLSSGRRAPSGSPSSPAGRRSRAGWPPAASASPGRSARRRSGCRTTRSSPASPHASPAAAGTSARATATTAACRWTSGSGGRTPRRLSAPGRAATGRRRSRCSPPATP